MTQTLNSRALQNLPDFALLELCPHSDSTSDCDILESLIRKATVLPIQNLLPHNQLENDTKNLTWIKILNYYYRLSQRCIWQKTSLQISGSDWGLHYHSATPSLHLKTRAMYMFLSAHFALFKATCMVPPLPQYSVQHLGHVYKLVSHNPFQLEQHLVAGEAEVSLLWHRDSLPLLFHMNAPSVPGPDRLMGYFAFNVRAVLSPVQSAFHVLGIEVHVIHTTLTELTALHQVWSDLVESCQAYLQLRELNRPVSRSPKRKKVLLPPKELVKQIANAVRSVARLLKVKTKQVSQCITEMQQTCVNI